MDWSNLVGKGVLVQFRDPVLLAARNEESMGYGIAPHYLRTPEGEIPAMLPALAAKVVGANDVSVTLEYNNGAGDECLLSLAKTSIVAVTEVKQRGKILTLRTHLWSGGATGPLRHESWSSRPWRPPPWLPRASRPT